MIRTLFALMLTALPVTAEEWNIRPRDGRMEADEVRARIVGQEVLFMDGGVARYDADGRYAYTYQGGRAFEGDYSIDDDGVVCVDFDAGQKRCDLYVLHDQRLVMIAETGRRFPTTPDF